MNNIFDKELQTRIISVFFFVPLVILPILYSNYATLLIYLIFTSIILVELDKIRLSSNVSHTINLYSIVTVISFFLFLLILLTVNKASYKLISIICIIWMFDTFSYLGGKLIGGKKLMPNISSGKTVSGLISGIIGTLCLFLFIQKFYLFQNQFGIYTIFLFTIIAFIGDACVSLLKRKANVKDSGKIMPGHGGLLDRFDSFITVFFLYGLISLL